jgi:hypothetical protein
VRIILNSALKEDENARPGIVKLIKYSRFRAFWPHFREENCDAL